MYVMVLDHGYEGYSVSEFDTYPELAKAVFDEGPGNISELYKVTETLDKYEVFKDFEVSMTTAREKALAKLSDEDIIALGITR